MASNVAVPVEEELYTLDEIRRAYSTTIDEVSVIKAEFEYSKDIDTAVSDVTNAITKIKSKLPQDIKELQIIIDKDKLDSYHLSLAQVIANIKKNDSD